MFDKDIAQLMQNPWYLAYEAALFAAVAAPIWHISDRLVDYLWARFWTWFNSRKRARS
jgi:hypothetical protein